MYISNHLFSQLACEVLRIIILIYRWKKIQGPEILTGLVIDELRSGPKVAEPKAELADVTRTVHCLLLMNWEFKENFNCLKLYHTHTYIHIYMCVYAHIHVYTYIYIISWVCTHAFLAYNLSYVFFVISNIAFIHEIK